MDLTFLRHSCFLTALGGAILNSFLQGFLLWSLYETVILSYKNTTAKFKHGLSVLLTLCSFIWFIGTFILKFGAAEKAAGFALGINNLENLNNGSQTFLPIFLSLTGDMLPYLSLAYIFLLLFFTAKFVTAYGEVHLIRQKKFIIPPVHLQVFVGKTAAQLGISKKIMIRITHHIKVPTTIGFLKPLILIPFASINQLTVSQLEAIILHELSHIKRNDYLVNLAVSAIGTLLFFNPFIGIFIKIIKRERENCCDDFVLQYHRDPYSYASALLRLAQSRKNHLLLSLPAVSGKNELLMRIKRITGQSLTTEFHYAHKLLALLITTIVFCSFGWLSPELQKKGKNVLLKTNNPIIREIKVDAIAKTVTSEKNVEWNTDRKNYKIQQKVKTSQKINVAVIKQPQGVKTLDQHEKNKVAARNLYNSLLSAIQAEEHQSYQNNNSDHAISEIQIENAGINIDALAEKEIQHAFQEISKINLAKIKNNINKSFSTKKMDELSAKQKVLIIQAGKYFSQVNIDKKLSEAAKILSDIQQQQMMPDNFYRPMKLPVISQQKVRLAEQYRRSELQILNNSIKNFGFNYPTQPDRNKSKENNTSRNDEPIRKVNGEKWEINIQKVPLHPEALPYLNKKVKKTQQIIEI